MIDTYASAKEAAERVISEFTTAIDWGIAESKSSKKQNLSSTIESPNLKQNAILNHDKYSDYQTQTVVEHLTQILIELSSQYRISSVERKQWAISLKNAVAYAIKKLQSLSYIMESRADLEEFISLFIINSGDREIMINAIEKATDVYSMAIKENYTVNTYVNKVEGFQFDRGWVSLKFVTDKKYMEFVFTKPYILVTDKNILSITEILPVLELAAQIDRRIVIIANNVEDEVVVTVKYPPHSKWPPGMVNSPGGEEHAKTN